jgi:hypothetical protein
MSDHKRVVFFYNEAPPIDPPSTSMLIEVAPAPEQMPVHVPTMKELQEMERPFYAKFIGRKRRIK